MSKEVKKILVVDDEKDLIETLKYRLEDAGYIVLVALDGLEGLEKAKEFVPDIILLDIMMPRMDGYQACRALKHDSGTKHIPVVILTAKGQEIDKQKAKEAGADGYIVKPFEGKDLIKKLNEFLKV